MENSGTASDSKTTIVENGSDPPDVSSIKVSTENRVEGGDVKKEVSKDEEENSSVGEIKGVTEETEGIADLKNGVDKKDDEEVAVQNKNHADKNYDGNEKEPRSTEDGEEEKDSREVKDFEGIEDGKPKEEMEKTQESKKNKEIEETVYLDGKKDAVEARDGLETKDGGDTDEVEGKKDGDTNEVEGEKDVREAMDLEKQKDAKEDKEGEEHKEMDIEKGFEEIKDEEGEKIVENIKHDGESSAVEGVSAEEISVAELRDDTGGKIDVQALNNAKDDGEKNDISDVKGTRQKKVVEEGKVHKDVNDAGLLKDSKNVQGAHGINDGGQTRDVDNENDAGNISKISKNKGVKAKKKPKTISKVEAGNVKKKGRVDEKSEENAFNSGLEKGKEGNAEGENVVDEEDDDGDIEKQSPRKKAAMPFKKKRVRGERSRKKGEVKGKTKEKKKKESGEKAKEPLISPVEALSSSPVISSRERPVRERKVVERLVEVIEKEPNKAVIIEKGRGTTLKDIPNVAYKLARKKPVDLKFLHHILFGRRGKIVEFKNHILQFSGFAWPESEEKQRAKIKEKLDKCIKDDLLDICDLLDMTLSKTSIKKEEIIAKLVEFLEAPRATTDVILAEKDQSEKSRKRKRPTGSASRSSGGTPANKSRRRGTKAEGTPRSQGKTPGDKEDETEDEGTKNDVPDEEDDAPRHSESDAKENESAEASDAGDENDDVYEKEKEDVVPSPKKQSSAVRERRKTGSNSKKVSPQTEAKSPVKTKQSKVKKDDAGEKVFTRRKKKVSESPKASDDEGENEDADDLRKINQDIKQSPKPQVSSVSNKRKRTATNSKKSSSQTVAKSTVKTPSSNKQSKVEKDDTGEKVFTRKKKTQNHQKSQIRSRV
ncbi:hypothetical protein KSP40_PGU013504 [Platanthera guangdongensis]|uniref:DEK n=1 Tax=Platanthera guangdongensis TaxID=2320717 RepID=A0ABR2LX33_9ASPA